MPTSKPGKGQMSLPHFLWAQLAPDETLGGVAEQQLRTGALCLGSAVTLIFLGPHILGKVCWVISISRSG